MARAFPGTSALIPIMLCVSACAQDATDPESGSEAPAFVSATAAFTDGFDAWDPGRWSAEEHPLGRGWFRTANVSVSGGTLALTSPAGTPDGGEIASLDRFGNGRFSARLRCRMPAGALCAFFLYEGVPGDRNDEIDFEVLGGTRTLWMTTWSRGRQTNHAEVTLPFDPAAAFHVYTIEYERASIRFLVDGALHAQFTRSLPRKAMRLLANAWWPVWLNAPLSPVDAFLEIDWIEVG